MIIQSIRFHNFGAYRGEQVILPSAHNASSTTLTLIGGLNGAGKTSLLEAVMLALYGIRSPSARESGVSYSRYLNSLVNRDTPPGSLAWVEIAMDIENEGGVEKLRIRRTWSAARQDAAERIQVYRNGELDKFLSSQWTTYVEELIPVGLAGLFFFDGEKISALAGHESTPDQVKHSIRSLLGLDLVDRAIDDLNALIRRTSNELDDSEARHRLRMQMDEKRHILIRQDSLRQDIAQHNAEISVLERNLYLKNEEYIRSGGDLFEQRQEHVDELRALGEQVAEKRAYLVVKAGSALPLLLVRDLLACCAADAKKNAQVRDAQVGLPLLAARNTMIREWFKQVDSPEAEALGLLLDHQEQELRNMADMPIQSPLSPFGEAQLSHLLMSLADEIGEETVSTVEAMHHIAHMHDELQRRLNAQLDEGTLSMLMGEISNITQAITVKQQMRDALAIEVSRMNAEMEKTDRAIELHAGQLVSNTDTNRIISHSVKAQETLRAFRTKVTYQKVNRLEECIFDAFTLLARKDSLVSRIEINPDTLVISLFDPQGREVPKARLSSGEKQMLAISILWGLARASGRKIPIIVDTPMGRLDSSHRMNFVSKYLPNASHQVIVLSTDTEIVGPYLEALKHTVGRSYLLRNKGDAGTTITDGYFCSTGGSSDDC